MAHRRARSDLSSALPVVLALSVMALAGCATSAPTAPSPSPSCGINVLLTEGSEPEDLWETMLLVGDLGCDVVVVNLQWCLDGLDGEVRQCPVTPEETLVVEAIDRAREQGLEVRLRPLVNEEAVGWRGELPPRRRWLRSYRDRVVELARFAQSQDVETLYVASELHEAMAEAPGVFGDLIWAVRAEYDGQIAVTEFVWSAHPLPESWFIDDRAPFGAGVGLVGASFYPEVTDCSGDLHAQVEHFLDRVRAESDALLLQADEISEFGTVPTCNPNSSSWDRRDDGDFDYQARLYDAVLVAARELGMATTIAWGLEVSHPEEDFGPFGPRPPARDVLRATFR